MGWAWLGWAWLGCSAGSFIRGDYQKSDTNGCLPLLLSPPAFDAAHRVELRGSLRSKLMRQGGLRTLRNRSTALKAYCGETTQNMNTYHLITKRDSRDIAFIKNVQNYVLISIETF
jgi:hypothetical protein